jgi:tellurite resistance protein TerC
MMGIGTPTMWGIFVGFVLVALVVDFAAMRSQGAHRVGMR